MNTQVIQIVVGLGCQQAQIMPDREIRRRVFDPTRMVNDEQGLHALVEHDLSGCLERHLGVHLRHTFPHDVLSGQRSGARMGICTQNFGVSNHSGCMAIIQYDDLFDPFI